MSNATDKNDDGERHYQFGLVFVRRRNSGVYEIEANKNEVKPPTINVLSPIPVDLKVSIRDKAIKWLEILLGVATLIVLVYYTQATFIQSEAAIKSAMAAKSAADTAADALKSSTNSFKIEQRAYVATTQAAMSNPPKCIVPDNSFRVCVDIHIANSGKTPAVGVRLHRYATFGKNAEKTIKAMKIPAYVTPDGGLLGTVGDQWGSAFTDPVDEATGKTLVDGDETIYVYGVAQYFDVFGEYHETGYCYHRVMPRGTAFIGCEFGNWFDKRPDKK